MTPMNADNSVAAKLYFLFIELTIYELAPNPDY